MGKVADQSEERERSRNEREVSGHILRYWRASNTASTSSNELNVLVIPPEFILSLHVLF
ncbi:uncharacterized protein G2W53_005946 [Senna tora]|uniref:Uncharacterized protein n=1 Tax=Senna tora TaxID=362788 RepID=A0A835CCD5_9FABA|nr:uncharacterized protein G2W53_005946 [Senna tora]